MGLINVTNITDGTTADAADVNSQINTIVSEFNGNIENANIKSGAAISGSKLADNSIDLGSKASVFDGWVKVTDSWAYASSTTVTVPSDATTKFSVGDKIKFDNSSTKYFYVTAVSSTVLTLNGGTDYTVANSAISNVYYSKAATPLSFPQWFNYTPTWTNLTVASSTVTAKFAQIGKTVFFHIAVVLGGGNAPSGAVSFSLPVTAITYAGTATTQVIGQANYNDTGTNVFSGPIVWATTTTAQLKASAVSGSAIGSVALSSTAPHTWANTDEILLNGFYEAA